MSDPVQIDGLDAARSGHWWQAFTGLIPVIFMVPILLAQAYALGVLVAFVGVAAVIGYHLLRGQGVTSLDALAAVFAAANLVLYFVFDSSILIEHLDAAFYTLMAAQSLFSLRVSSPWTMQFTRRTVIPELWTSEAFIAMNVRTTQLWAACFVLCDIAALTLPDPSRLWVPVVLMLATVAVSRRVGRRIFTDRLGVTGS